MKNYVLIILLLIGAYGFTQNDTFEWPREIKAGTNYMVTLYQPELESLNGNKLSGRLALSIKDKEDKIIFGALWFDARLATDLESRTAVLEALEIPKIKFPDIKNEDNIEILKKLIIDDLSATDIEMSLDNIIASLENVESKNIIDENISNKSPDIYFRNEPTVLVSIDGEPILKKTDDGKLEYVINTPFLIVKEDDSFYLKGEKSWYNSSAIKSSEWKTVTSVSKSIEKFANEQFEGSKSKNKDDEDERIPNIIVSTSPAELIVTTGDIEYKPIKGTSLLYVDNTENDIILEIDSQTHFVLLNGRWFNSKSLKDGEWNFVEPSNLPESFKAIPADAGSISSVRVSIPGTDEAKEAMYEQYIPQTAEVDKKTASTEVTYDGNPQFKKIDDTNMEYAVNTQSTVLRIDSKYYVVDNGVWFESNNANGPWKVSESRPDEVKDIPPSSPVYNVKYVYIYDSTPDVVYVGYTPGYYHSYIYGGVVVYGTGYYYTPWYGAYYYSRPVTFGFGVHYNPYTGWGFSVGVSYGWMTLSFHSYGYWGPAGYRHGYRHGYYHGYHHGYHNGYAAGYARGRFDSNNVYRRSNGQARTGISTRRGETTQARDFGSMRNSRNSSDSRRNNLFADKSGKIYQRNDDGRWSEKRNDTKKEKRINRDNSNNINKRPERSNLDRQFNNRRRGNNSTRSFNSSKSSRGTRQALPRRRG